MAELNPSESDAEEIRLKDPLVAGVLGWLVPGLGHFYQGRTAKGILYAVCILGTFLYGLYLGGSSEVGWGRSVYMSFRPNDLRLPWLCQIGVGFPTLPVTLMQAHFAAHGTKPWWYGFMAPPELENPEANPFRNEPDPARKSLSEIQRLLPRYFEMGTVYTMIAGLLNILAVYDACCGPVPAEKGKKDDEDDASTEEEAEDKQ